MKSGVLKPEGCEFSGVFIKGDDALYRFAPAIRALAGDNRHDLPEHAVRKAAEELLTLLLSCEDV
jgi:hypothetical protein